MCFEILERDLLARIGRLETKSGKIETERSQELAAFHSGHPLDRCGSNAHCNGDQLVDSF